MGNWNVKLTVIVFLGVFCYSARPAQTQSSDPMQLASGAVDQFLTGMKLADLPEGRTMLAGTEWMPGRFGYRLLVYTDTKTIYEGLFDTDLAGIRGYKRLLEMDTLSEAHTPLKARYIAVAYPDRKTGKWKVLSMAGDSEIDIDRNVAFYKKRLDDSGESQESDYLWYGHFLLMGGRIRDAQASLLRAKDTIGTNPPTVDAQFPQLPVEDRKKLSLDLAQADAAHINELLDAIRYIAGPPN